MHNEQMIYKKLWHLGPTSITMTSTMYRYTMRSPPSGWCYRYTMRPPPVGWATAMKEGKNEEKGRVTCKKPRQSRTHYITRHIPYMALLDNEDFLEEYLSTLDPASVVRKYMERQ
jgi:hypothetical protein